MDKKRTIKKTSKKQSAFFLKGERCLLTPFEVEDVDYLAKLTAKWVNDGIVTYFMFTGQKPQNIHQTTHALMQDLENQNHVMFLVREDGKQTPIGYAGLWDINMTSRKAEFRILIGERKFRGKGYGTEITELVTFYGFDRLNLNRIYLGYTAQNTGAGKAYEKAGYQYEGTLREDIYRNSTYYDTIRMSILRKDYYDHLHSLHRAKFQILPTSKNSTS